MKSIILHIPHSSINIPNKNGFVLSKEEIDSELLKLTDWYTDDLFYSPKDISIKANFSRLFCDTERFVDDDQEVMAKYGMGVLYEKTDDGRLLRVVSPELRAIVIKQYYWVHHNKFTQVVERQLKENGTAMILDCHSYPSSPIIRDLDQNPNRPDFNIGIDSFHTPQSLVDISKEFFGSRGYSLGINWPYSGCIVPLKFYQKEKNVKSIMLEINRKLYLEEPTNTKSKQYGTIKEITSEFIKTLRKMI
jgi:N-formylglutamate deformylase